MIDPEQEFEYEQKCERIAMEIEMLILDGIVAALGRVKQYLQDDDNQTPKPSKDVEPF
ncbi:MAG: hypothetical protein KFF68_01710 [Desulfosarcina sp.]|nr:hypothetical protein [Desulfosarcina sp.]